MSQPRTLAPVVPVTTSEDILKHLLSHPKNTLTALSRSAEEYEASKALIEEFNRTHPSLAARVTLQWAQ